MMILDVNVVLAAHRQDHPSFAQVRPWFDGMIASDRPFGVPEGVWASFLRIATNRRIFEVPTPRPEAFAFARAVRGQPSHMRVSAGPRHVDVFEQLCVDGDATGDLAADAYLAAMAVELGCELVSLDRDFARFPGLRWRRPVADPEDAP
jgi:toxin-antitoxin system PIN domain toxin